jgi:hypothetical protein
VQFPRQVTKALGDLLVAGVLVYLQDLIGIFLFCAGHDALTSVDSGACDSAYWSEGFNTMPSTHNHPPEHTDYTPNFELPRHGAIREDNWPEFQAKGFLPVIGGLEFAQAIYGVEHVYTGDAYDYAERRPLRHIPRVGYYSDPEGLEHADRRAREREQRMRERGYTMDSSGGGPGAS